MRYHKNARLQFENARICFFTFLMRLFFCRGMANSRRIRGEFGAEHARGGVWYNTHAAQPWASGYAAVREALCRQGEEDTPRWKWLSVEELVEEADVCRRGGGRIEWSDEGVADRAQRPSGEDGGAGMISGEQVRTSQTSAPGQRACRARHGNMRSVVRGREQTWVGSVAHVGKKGQTRGRLRRMRQSRAGIHESGGGSTVVRSVRTSAGWHASTGRGQVSRQTGYQANMSRQSRQTPGRAEQFLRRTIGGTHHAGQDHSMGACMRAVEDGRRRTPRPWWFMNASIDVTKCRCPTELSWTRRRHEEEPFRLVHTPRQSENASAA